MASVDVMYDEMPQLDVVGDVALLHNLDSQDALVQHKAQFDESLVSDNRAIVDLVINDLSLMTVTWILQINCSIICRLR